MKHVAQCVWYLVLLAAVLMYGAYEIEAKKTEATVAQECFKAGDEWITAWNWRTYCKDRHHEPR